MRLIAGADLARLRPTCAALAKLSEWPQLLPNGMPKLWAPHSKNSNKGLVMPLSNEEVNEIYEEIVSGRQAAKANAVRPMGNPELPDIVPEIVYRDKTGEAISIPVKENSDRDVYVRRHGEPWRQVSFSPAPNDPLSAFAAPGVVEEAVRVLDVAEAIVLLSGNGEKELVRASVQRAFDTLNREGALISVDALVKRCLAGR